jgi:hypothetical protein
MTRTRRPADDRSLRLAVSANVRPIVASGSLPLRDGDCARKTDLVVASSPNLPVCWNHVRLVGEFKSNQDASDCDSTIVQLANYVREVFGRRGTRSTLSRCAEPT